MKAVEGRATGLEVSFREVQAVRVRDGKVIEGREYSMIDEALEAVG